MRGIIIVLFFQEKSEWQKRKILKLGGQPIEGNIIQFWKGETPEEAIARTFKTGGAKEYRQNTSYSELLSTDKAQDTIQLPDETLPRSLSAKWANEDILMPNGGIAHFVEGSKLHHKEVFAGKWTKTSIRDVERLVQTYGGKPEDWQKVKCIGSLEQNGKNFDAEIHWYQKDDYEKKEIKFKKEL